MYLTDFCCFCLDCNRNVKSHYSVGLDILEIMTYVMPKSVIRKNAFPIQICDTCLNILRSFFKFRQKCLDNMATFNNCVDRLKKKHGPYKYLSVAINKITSEEPIDNQNNVENSEKPTDVTIKNEILEDFETNTENQNEDEIENIELILIKEEPNDGENIPQILIKVEPEITTDQDEIDVKNIEQLLMNGNSVDNLYKKELNEEFIIKDDPSLFDNDTEDKLSSNYLNLEESSVESTVFSDAGNENDIQSTSTVQTETENRFECTVCHEIFPKKYKLEVHTRIHTGKKPYECLNCPRTFFTAHLLTKHKRKHMTQDLDSPDICPKKSKTQSELKSQKRVYLKEPLAMIYKCETCNKSFAYSCNYKRHQRIHTGERPFSCEVCNATFSDSGNYRKHRRMHLDIRPHKCDVCEKTFRQAHSLKAHKFNHVIENRA